MWEAWARVFQSRSPGTFIVACRLRLNSWLRKRDSNVIRPCLVREVGNPNTSFLE